MRFLFRKGAIEMILHIHKVGEISYYQLLKKGFLKSRESFSILLKELEKENIVERRVLDMRPPRALYALTSEGKDVAEVLEKLEKILRKNNS